jgi:drug/metabolite transporter (DMT)-like permease
MWLAGLFMSSTKTRAILALIIAMLFWGSSAVFIRTLALALSPENSLAMRYLVLTGVNIAGLAWLGTWRIPRTDWPRFLITGIAGMAGYNWFVNAGFELVPAGVGALVTMVEPLMIAILASFLLGERLTRYVMAGVVLAMAGGAVLFWPEISATAPSSISAVGVGYLLVSCAAWAIYTILAKPLLARHDSFTVTAVTMLIAAPIMIGAASEPLHGLAAALDLRQWLEVCYLVFAAGLGGTILWNYGTKHLSSSAAGTFLYLIPVVAVAAGALMLKEPVTLHIVSGGLLMLAGVAAAQFGPVLFRARG